MLYVEIDLPSRNKEGIPIAYDFDNIIDIIIIETNKFIFQELKVIGIVLKRDVYDFLLKHHKENSRWYNNIKCDKIESLYGFKVAIKE